MSEQGPPIQPPAGEQHEASSELVGMQLLEAQFADSPHALALNTALALSTALRGSGSVLRTNQDTDFLGTPSQDLVVQGYHRLLHPEATNFQAVYTGLFESIVPSTSSTSSVALFMASNIEERTAYANNFADMSKEERFECRNSIIEADKHMYISLEQYIEAALQEYISNHTKAPDDLFNQEVLAAFCERTLRSAPVIKTVRGVAVSSLMTHRRATGLSARARAWLRTHGGFHTPSQPQ